MALTTTQLREIELAAIRPQQGGRIDLYNPTGSGISTELRWQPHLHGNIALWTDATWVIINPDYIPATTSNLDISGQDLVPNANYDVFVKYQTATSGSLEFSRWYGDNARRQYPPKHEGIYVYDETGEGKKMRLVGAVRLTTVSGINYFTNTISQRFTVNWDNRILSAVKAYQNGTSWSVNTGGFAIIESWGGSGLTRGEFLSLESICYAGGSSVGQTAGNTENWSEMGAYMNSTVLPAGPMPRWTENSSSAPMSDHSSYAAAYTRLGYNYFSIGMGGYASMSFTAMDESDYRTAGSLMVYI